MAYAGPCVIVQAVTLVKRSNRQNPRRDDQPSNNFRGQVNSSKSSSSGSWSSSRRRSPERWSKPRRVRSLDCSLLSFEPASSIPTVILPFWCVQDTRAAAPPTLPPSLPPFLPPFRLFFLPLLHKSSPLSIVLR
ncbi:hypothetical protein VYU27_004095 [Nannochloropsis oceanica]